MDRAQSPRTVDDLLVALKGVRQQLDDLERAALSLKRSEAAPAEAPVSATEPVDIDNTDLTPWLAPAQDRPFIESITPPIPPTFSARPVPPPIPPVDPPAAPAQVTAPAPAKPKPATKKGSFEQQIGTRWMLIVGVVVLLLAAVFFFKYAFDKGWISKERRLLTGAVVALTMIGLGEWAFFRRMRLWAGCVIGCGVVMLYLVAFVASPNGLYKLVDAKTAFLLMCGVTVIGAAVSLHTRILATAVVAMLGAFATPVMLSTGTNQEMVLMTYLLIVNAGFLGIALLRRWPILAPLALVGTLILYGGWYASFGPPSGDVFPWIFFGLFTGYALRAQQAGHLKSAEAGGMIAVAAVALGLLWHGMALTPVSMAVRLVAMEVIVLSLALIRRWAPLAVLALIGMILLYPAAGAWPQWLAADVFAWVLFALFTAYCLAAELAGHVERSSAVPLVALAAVAMGVLWSTMGLAPAGMATRLIVMEAILLSLALIRRWQPLAALALIGVFLLYPIALARPQRLAGEGYMWGMLGLLIAYGVVGVRLQRTKQWLAELLIALAGFNSIRLLATMNLSGPAVWPRLFALAGVVLAVCLCMRWNWTRLVALAWTAAGLASFRAAESASLRMELSVWIWAIFALFAADVLIRAWLRRFQTQEKLDAVIATIAVAAMFASTYGLLNGDHHAWMGPYAAAASGLAILAAWRVHCKAGRRVLGWAFLAQGLTLLTLAVPIQFDWSATTIAWAAEALAATLVAKRLGNRLVMALCPVAMLLAVMHFFHQALPHDPTMGLTAMVLGGVAVTKGLLLATGLSVAMLLAAAILRSGSPIGRKDEEIALTVAFTLGAALLFIDRTGIELPPVMASGCWCVLGAGLLAVAAWRKSDWLCVMATLMLLAVAAKWLFSDTLYRRFDVGSDTWRTLVFNWQLGVGVATGIALLAASRWTRRCLATQSAKNPGAVAFWRTVLLLVALLVFVWGGSFEVDRYFASVRETGNHAQAMQMAYSLWWGLYAAVLLAVGFIARRAAIRWMSLAIFAVTLAKILLVDMRDVDAVYRIASFLGLGVLFLAASWLYHRSFAAKAEKVMATDEGTSKRV